MATAKSGARQRLVRPRGDRSRTKELKRRDAEIAEAECVPLGVVITLSLQLEKVLKPAPFKSEMQPRMNTEETRIKKEFGLLIRVSSVLLTFEIFAAREVSGAASDSPTAETSEPKTEERQEPRKKSGTHGRNQKSEWNTHQH